MLKKIVVLITILPLLALTTIKFSEDRPTDPPFVDYSSYWVDSVFNSLSLEQKVGQLFMVAVYPKLQNQSAKEKYIKKYNIGGIIYFKGHPTRVAELTNHFQSISKVPLMVAIDGEWGVGMRLDSVEVFPHQLMLGAVSDNKLIYAMGEQIAEQCKVLGINVNFAPVADINNNYKNPVIGVRAFGEDKEKVTQKSYSYSAGMQDNYILAVAKHFPGHGDTDVDSHKDLPVINASLKRLDTLELYPFKHLINSGIGGMMMAHLYVPALDDTKNLPSSLSPQITTDILKNTLGFSGLVFTDALGMQGVAKYYASGNAEIQALKAGVDILLMPDEFITAYNAVLNAVKSNTISIDLIDEKVKKILQAKYWMKLDKYQPIDTKTVYSKLNSPQMQLINRKLVESALTLIQNNDSTIPIKHLGTKKIASVSIGDGNATVFQDYLSRYAKIDNYFIDKKANISEFSKLKDSLAVYDYVIIGVHKTKQYAVKTYGITSASLNFVSDMAKNKNVILDLFGSPYALKRFSNLSEMLAILVSYEDTDIAQELSAQLIFGGISARGTLPVGINADFPYNTGLFTSNIRLKYTIPAELNIRYEKIYRIDTLIYNAIAQKAFPGCQIMAIKNGAVFFQKSYGYHTYKMKNKVKWSDLYDIASITKVAATTTSLMKLYDDDKFDVNKKISDYLPELLTTNKRNLSILDIMTHQARLTPWIPFYKKALNKDGSWNTNFISKKYSEKYNVKISENMYLSDDFQDLLYERIKNSDLLSKKKYKYSDLGFYLLKKVVEKNSKTTLDKYVADNFYKSLGANFIGYNPTERGFSKDRIPPTEYDFKFRKRLVHGCVHDYGAAILSGVGGHAGLFSNTNDLAKLAQMFLQSGKYAGQQYIKPETINLFTSRPFTNSRRAIGFDATDGHGEGPACSLSSASSFGHTGFTGCMIWIDPEYDFVYIFLSNRVYPDIENKKILELNVRESTQSILYQSFMNYTN